MVITTFFTTSECEQWSDRNGEIPVCLPRRKPSLEPRRSQESDGRVGGVVWFHGFGGD
jgi:hypothetical protein